MKPRALLLSFALAVTWPLGAHAAAVEGRFSQMISTNQSVEAGINKLSSDQVAVLDALVRRDFAHQSATRRKDAPSRPAKFSERLTADERRNAGLDQMPAAQVEYLDKLVERYAEGTLARALLAPPVYVSSTPRLRETEARTTPEIHGSFTLQYGFGHGGYSEKAGGMTLNYDDPVHKLNISFSYWESHTTGGIPYRDDYVPYGASPFGP